MKRTVSAIVAVMNNDLLINNNFFKKIVEAYENEWAIICPNSVKDVSLVYSVDDKVVLKPMGKREGWCWIARKSFLNKVKPIPNFLRTYCGDDYIFFNARILNFQVLKMMNNYIHHFGGGTIQVTKECWGERQKEKVLWNNYKLKEYNQ
jgi:hypothetical protein